MVLLFGLVHLLYMKSQKGKIKGGFAIIALAGCDADARFISATANHSGSTNDIVAWNNSKLCKAVEHDKCLPPKYFYIGDKAFMNHNQFLSPWPGRGLDKYKDSFNYWLSHSRQIVERSFGMLTQHWGIFWRIFTFSLHRWSLVMMACMKLHNLCIDRNVAVPLHGFPEDNRDGDEWVLLDNTQDDDVFLRGRASGDRQRNITTKSEALGVIHPIHAECNSRK
jgi:hypothetical protein